MAEAPAARTFTFEEASQPTAGRTFSFEEATAPPAAEPPLRSRTQRAVESARGVGDLLRRTIEEPGARSTGERALVGGVTGAIAPELTAMTGMGLQLFPPTRPAGALLQSLAPSLGAIRGRTAALGAVGGAAGGYTEQQARAAGFSPEAASALGTGAEFVTGSLPVGGFAARAARPVPVRGQRGVPEQTQEIGAEAIARGEEQAARAIREARGTAAPRFRAQRGEERAAGAEIAEVRRTLEMAPTEARVGELMLDTIERNVGGLREARRTVANDLYREADAAMQAKHNAGDVWQLSPSGRQFLDRLSRRISLRGGTTQTTTEEQRLIQDVLLPNLRGRSLPDQPASTVLGPTGEPLRGPVTGRVAYSEPNVLRETLRKLRDAARGLPEEGYAAIGQQRAGQLADELSRSLAQWESSLARADARYREMSDVLLPVQTRRGRAATATERYSAEEMAVDPANLPRMFFSSPQSVQQFRALTGNNTEAVNRIAALHVASNLRGKTPQQARQWLESNRDWLNPTVLPEPYRVAEGFVTRLEGATARAEQARKSATGTVERFVAGAREQRKAVQDARRTINEAVATLDVADPSKLPQRWGEIRERLQSTGLVSSADLDRLGRDIQRAALESDRQKRREQTRAALIRWGASAIGLGGAYGTFSSIFGGR